MAAKNNFFIAGLQKALNAYLALDPESAARLLALQGKVVTIELLAIGIVFHFSFSGKEIQLRMGSAENPDTIIKGTPLRLLHMVISKKNRQQFFADDISIEGNLELGQVVIDLFDHLEIDWEEKLSHVCGDVASHQIGRIGRKIKSIARLSRRVLNHNLNEYLHEEINFFPPREALDDFFRDVDSIRMDTDRLEAKINWLRQMLDARGHK